MPDYTSILGLYLPNKVDDLSVIDTLVENFEKIDDASLKDSYGIVSLKSFLPANRVLDTDTTPAFIEALKYMKDNGLGVLIVPPGTYSLSATVTIPSNTTIVMHKNTLLRRLTSGGFFINFDRNQDTSEMKGNHNITLIGGTLDHRGRTGEVEKQSNMTGWQNGRNLRVIGVTFRDGYGSHCLDLVGMYGVEIAYCTFEGFKWFLEADSKRYYGESIQIDLSSPGTLPTNTNPLSQDLNTARDINIHHNRWKRSAANPYSAGRAIGTHSFSETAGSSFRIIITNNIFEDVLDHCFYSYAFQNNIFSNNICRNCGSGVRIVPNAQSIHYTVAPINVYRSLINGNTITGMRQHTYTTSSNTNVNPYSGYGITTAGHSDTAGTVYEINISGNNISDTDNEPISCEFTRRLIISGNSVKQANLADTNTIRLTSCNAFCVVGNTMFTSKAHSIGIYDCEDGTVYGNLGYGTVLSGLHITSDSDRIVAVGNIFQKTNSAGGNYGGISMTNGANDNLIAMNNVCDQASGAVNSLYSSSATTNNHVWGNKVGGNGSAATVSLGGTGNSTSSGNIST
jgi:hypothetical protein